MSDLRVDDFVEAQKRKQYLFEAGRRVAKQCLERWGPDLTGEPRRLRRPATQAAHSHDEQAVATASAMMEGFADRLSRLARKQLFISYSHRDQEWLDVIKAPLEPYVELHGLKVWDDRHIPPGEDWRKTIADALAQTRVALLLVSPGFIKSEFIREEELRYFLDAAERYAVKVHSAASERPRRLRPIPSRTGRRSSIPRRRSTRCPPTSWCCSSPKSAGFWHGTWRPDWRVSLDNQRAQLRMFLASPFSLA